MAHTSTENAGRRKYTERKLRVVEPERGTGRKKPSKVKKSMKNDKFRRNMKIFTCFSNG